MALMKELVRRLDDDSEPLPKRIKLGKNALLSNELYLQKKEDTIINWFCSKLENEEYSPELVQIIIECCTSEHFLQLNTTDIQEKTKKLILHVLSEQLENNNQDVNLVNLSIIICENPIMNQYLKNNINDYIEYVNKIIKHIIDKKQLNQILENFLNIYKTVKEKSEALNMLINDTLLILSQLCGKLTDTHSRIVDFVHQVLFPIALKNQYKNTISNLFKIDEESTEKSEKESNSLLLNFITKFRSIYSNSDINDLKNLLNIYVGGFIKCFKSDTKVIFQLFVVFAKLFGLENEIKFNKSIKNVKKFSIEKSLSLFCVLLSNLHEIKSEFNKEFLDKLKFNEYIQKLTKNIMKMTTNSFENVYQLFQILIDLNPNLVETISSDIIFYSMLNHKTSHQIQDYSKFMISLFSMFAKLHREQKLISIILRSLRTILNDDLPDLAFNIDDLIIDDYLPNGVISHLCEVMANFPGKTFIALFRTLISHLNNDIIANIDSQPDGKKFNILLQTQVTLINSFMVSATIADDLRSESVFIRFLDEMKEFKNCLKTFGSKILHLEHNCELMTSFLKMCCNWGELYIFLYHFKSNEDNISNYLSSDILNENYLHNYLRADQWNTIEQRIANFGELSCKQHLKKIFSQTNRLTILSERKIVDPNLLKLYSYNGVNLQIYKDLSDINVIAKNILNLSIENNNFEIIRSNYVQENMSLILSLIQLCLKKLYKELKGITKSQSDLQLNFKSQKLIKEIENNQSEDTEERLSAFLTTFNEDIISEKCNIEMKNILNLLSVLKQLPLAYCSEKIRVEMILLCMCFHEDCTQKNLEVPKLVEEIIENIVKINFPSKLLSILTLNQIINHIIQYNNFEILLKEIIQYVVRHENLIKHLKNIAKCCRNFDVLKHATIAYFVSKAIVNIKKTNFSIETKKMIRSITYKITISVSDILTEEHLVNGIIKCELYGLAIDRCLIRDKKNILDNLLKYFDKVLSLCLEVDGLKNEGNLISINDKTEFLNLVVRNKKKLEANLPEGFISKCALNNAENTSFNFSSLLTHSQPTELEIIINYLLDKTKLYLKNNSVEEFSRNIIVWQLVVEHQFNTTKSRIRQNALQIILREFLFSIKNSSSNSAMAIIMLKYIHKLLQTQVTLTPTMIDMILEILFEINHTKDLLRQDILEFESIFSISISILDVLLTFRSVLIMDRIQSVLVPFRLLLKKLCLRSQIQPNKNVENIISKCALNFQRTNENLVKHKKDTARIAPYLIADVLQYYEKVTFYPTTKNYLNSCLYALLNLCDTHANSFLLRNLSIPSKEIFKVIHDDFNKYYRFTGKS